MWKHVVFLFLVQQSILLYADYAISSEVLNNLGAKHLLRDKRELSDTAVPKLSKFDLKSILEDSNRGSAWKSKTQLSSAKQSKRSGSWPDRGFGSSEKPYSATYSDLNYEIPCGVSTVGSAPLKIVGGEDAQPGEFPWQVLLVKHTPDGDFMCGGAIVDSNWILTAAHCIIHRSVDNITAVVGNYKLDTIEASEQELHITTVVYDNYNAGTVENDIALLKVTPSIELNEQFAVPICIPREGIVYEAGTPATITGWGTLSLDGEISNTLQKVTVPIVEKSECDRVYTDAGHGDLMHDSQICTGTEEGGKDSCQSDAGDPLVCEMDDGRLYLCGLVSFKLGCGNPGIPSVYTSIPFFSNWVNSTVSSASGSKSS